MLSLGIKYSSRDLIYGVIIVRKAQSGDVRHIT